MRRVTAIPILRIFDEGKAKEFYADFLGFTVTIRRMHTTRVFHVIAAALSCVALAGCDGYIRVRGRVVDPAGAGVAAARIHLERSGSHRQFEHGVTPDGCFTVGHTVAPGRYHYNVRVTAPGFKPAEGRISTIDDNRAVIVLRPANESGRSSFERALGKSPKEDVTAQCGPAPCAKPNCGDLSSKPLSPDRR